MNLEKYQQYSRIARGLEKADLVLKDARIVNVFTEEIIRGDIAIQDGIIAGIGSFHGKEERDLAGRYVCPGFIDSHLHLESTLVTPAELVTVASRHGTTTFIVDPHESANVSGLAGIDYILDQTEDVKANVYVMMPSCVPATAIDDNGCTLTAEDMVPYLHNSRILGLGEVMDSISVVQGEKSMHDKLELFEGRIRDGHAPFLEEGDLQAYAMAGIATDHECSFFDYAMRERRNGLTILVREGSAARNLEYGFHEEELFLEMLDNLGGEGAKDAFDLFTARLATMACKSAVKGNHQMSALEADKLIDELLTLDNPYNCPHGRPTIIAMTKTEIEKKFKRIV